MAMNAARTCAPWSIGAVAGSKAQDVGSAAAGPRTRGRRPGPRCRLRRAREESVLAVAADTGEARLLPEIRPVGDDAASNARHDGDVAVVADERVRGREARVERHREP